MVQLKAMILAAGLGTRLAPLTRKVSKPMVQMAGRPCMEHAVRLLKKHGITDIIVNLHYMPDLIREHFGSGEAYGVQISYSYEKELLGTAGGFKRVQDFFGGQPALIISGDALTDINLRRFFAFHQQNKGIATLALKQVADPTQYGVVVLDGNRISRFQEKPRREEAVSTLANTGIYLFDPAVFAHIPAGTFYDFGKQVFPELLAKQACLCGYVMDEYWCDVGDLAMYREAHYDMLTGVVNVDLPGIRLEGHIYLGKNVTIAPGAKLVGPLIIGDHAVIEEGARLLGPVAVGSHAVIGSRSLVKRTILWDHVRLAANVELTDTIAATGCSLPSGLLLQGAVLEESQLQTLFAAATYKGIATGQE